jgi:hypothetical protein
LSALAETPGLRSLDQIESSLRTDVVDILRTCLQVLSGMDRETAYETVMNEPNLLHESFTLLRREPALFAKVIVDDGGQAVEAKDEQRLRCGQTLGYIKTLVLRASARRHFRRKLGGYRSVTVEEAAPAGRVQALLQRVGIAKPQPTVTRKRRIPGRGDLLYRAMREFLLFDWQARLIPHYVQLTPELVDAIGAALLSIREPTELRALAGEVGRQAMEQKQRPLFLSGARQLMRGSGDGIDSELLWKLWDQMGLDRLFENSDMSETRKIIAEVAATSKAAIAALMPILGEDVRQFIAFLFVAYRQLGRTEFRNVFAESSETQWLVQGYCDKLRALERLPVPELAEMLSVYGEILTPPHKPL